MNIPLKLKREMDKLDIKVSNLKNKKYMTILNNKKIHFGSKANEHFFDSTKLKSFSEKNHGDKKRRELFYKRHYKNIMNAIDNNKITPALLSAYFLW